MANFGAVYLMLENNSHSGSKHVRADPSLSVRPPPPRSSYLVPSPFAPLINFIIYLYKFNKKGAMQVFRLPRNECCIDMFVFSCRMHFLNKKRTHFLFDSVRK